MRVLRKLSGVTKGVSAFALAVCAVGYVTAGAAPYRQINGVCSAFDAQGDAVTVTLDVAQVTLQFTRASGATATLSGPFASATVLNSPGCKVYFGGTDGLVAIEVKREYPKESVHVMTADMAAVKWVGSFDVEPDEVLGPPITLAGFVPGSSSLLALGRPAGNDDPRKPDKAFSTALLNVGGTRLGPPVSQALPDGAGRAEYADVKNNRLWFDHAPDPCPISSTALTGTADRPGVNIWISRDICYVGYTPLFPDADTYLIGLSPQVDAGAVWRVDLKAKTADHIDLPDVSKSGLRIGLEGNVLSPDGEVVAILRDRRSYVVFGPKGSKQIELVQVRPLKYLGKMDFPEFTDSYSFSVDHRNGAITVLGFWDGKWQREQLKQK